MNIIDLSILDEEHICPDCNIKMKACEAPPVHVGDGLGWGSEVLFICLNDDCPTFSGGWDRVEANYGHKATFRCMQLPGSSEKNVMMVASQIAFTGSIIDTEQMKKQNERYIKEKEAIAALDSCVEAKNLDPVMTLILDEESSPEGRMKAVKLLIQLNDLSCIDAIRNHTFQKTAIGQACNLAITELLAKNYQKECPHCSELIKAQAKKCLHCKEEL